MDPHLTTAEGGEGSSETVGPPHKKRRLDVDNPTQSPSVSGDLPPRARCKDHRPRFPRGLDHTTETSTVTNAATQNPLDGKISSLLQQVQNAVAESREHMQEDHARCARELEQRISTLEEDLRLALKTAEERSEQLKTMSFEMWETKKRAEDVERAAQGENQLTTRCEELEALVRQEREAREAADGRVQEVDAQRLNAEKDLNDLRTELASLREENETLKQTAASRTDMEKTIEQMSAQKRIAEADLSFLRQNFNSTREERDAFETQLQKELEGMKNLKWALEVLNGQRRTAERDLEKLGEELDASRGETLQERSARKDMEARLADANRQQGELERLRREQGNIRQEERAARKLLEASLKEANDQRLCLERRIVDLEQERQSVALEIQTERCVAKKMLAETLMEYREALIKVRGLLRSQFTDEEKKQEQERMKSLKMHLSRSHPIFVALKEWDVLPLLNETPQEHHGPTSTSNPAPMPNPPSSIPSSSLPESSFCAGSGHPESTEHSAGLSPISSTISPRDLQEWLEVSEQWSLLLFEKLENKFQELGDKRARSNWEVVTALRKERNDARNSLTRLRQEFSSTEYQLEHAEKRVIHLQKEVESYCRRLQQSYADLDKSHRAYQASQEALEGCRKDLEQEKGRRTNDQEKIKHLQSNTQWLRNRVSDLHAKLGLQEDASSSSSGDPGTRPPNASA